MSLHSRSKTALALCWKFLLSKEKRVGEGFVSCPWGPLWGMGKETSMCLLMQALHEIVNTLPGFAISLLWNIELSLSGSIPLYTRQHVRY